MSLDFVARRRSPYIIVFGRDNALTLDIYTSAGVQITPNISNDTVTIKRGTTAVVTGVAITSAGPPASYTLLNAAITGTADPNERWRVEWTLTTSVGVQRTFVVPAWATNFDTYPAIIDADLTDLEPALSQITGASAWTSLQDIRERSFDEMARDLYDRDVKVHLIEDQGVLIKPHTMLSISKAFAAASNAVNDETWAGKAAKYRRMYTESLLAMRITYDGDDSGTADDKDKTANQGGMGIYAERPRQG